MTQPWVQMTLTIEKALQQCTMCLFIYLSKCIPGKQDNSALWLAFLKFPPPLLPPPSFPIC